MTPALRRLRPLWATLLTLGLPAAAPAAEAAGPDRFLVIGASANEARAIANKAALLDPQGEGLTLSTADCGERKPVWAWAAQAAASLDAARPALAALRTRVPDAFIKPCRVRPGSLLALGLPAVHPSIARVDARAVNWDEADRQSSAVILRGGATLVLQRYFDPVPEDPLEGRRVRVLLARHDAPPRVLSESCNGAGSVVSNPRWLAFACETEQAGEHVLHEVRAFGADGSPAATVPRCRQPRLDEAHTLSCRTEVPTSQAQLSLSWRSVSLPAAAR